MTGAKYIIPKSKGKLPKSRARTAYGLLSEVRRLILAEPKRYYQGWWRSRGREVQESGLQAPACGTVCCVAGWVVTLRHAQVEALGTGETAARILGLNATQADALFAHNALSVDAAPQTRAYAIAGAALIAWFQGRYAAQLKAKRISR